MKTILDRINEILSEEGLTKYLLAKKAGLKESTVYSLFTPGREKHRISSDTLTRIAIALNTSVEYLVTGVDSHSIQEKDLPLDEQAIAYCEMIKQMLLAAGRTVELSKHSKDSLSKMNELELVGLAAKAEASYLDKKEFIEIIKSIDKTIAMIRILFTNKP
jgi:transcriptional regulator with XRE-family HTH domain